MQYISVKNALQVTGSLDQDVCGDCDHVLGIHIHTYDVFNVVVWVLSNKHPPA
jgi:hypothetical protein